MFSALFGTALPSSDVVPFAQSGSWKSGSWKEEPDATHEMAKLLLRRAVRWRGRRLAK